MKHLFLSLSGLVAALRSDSQAVAGVLRCSMFCFDRPGLRVVTSPAPDGSTTAYYRLDGLEFRNERQANFVVRELDYAFVESRLYYPLQGRLDYQQLDEFLGRHSLCPTGLAGNPGYSYPDAIKAIFRANPLNHLLVYDHAGRPWSSRFSNTDDPEVCDPEVCPVATA